MRDYEVMTIHRPDLAEDDVESRISDLSELLSNRGAQVNKRDLWGKRRFSYEIDNLSEGFYSVLSFQSDPETVGEVDRMLTLADEVVRHKIVKIGD